MKNIIGPKVKEARLNFHPPLSQADLATKLQLNGWNIKRSGIAKIEIGLRQITDIELVVLAKTLHVDVNWLVGLKE